LGYGGLRLRGYGDTLLNPQFEAEHFKAHERGVLS